MVSWNADLVDALVSEPVRGLFGYSYLGEHGRTTSLWIRRRDIRSLTDKLGRWLGSLKGSGRAGAVGGFVRGDRLT